MRDIKQPFAIGERVYHQDLHMYGVLDHYSSLDTFSCYVVFDNDNLKYKDGRRVNISDLVFENTISIRRKETWAKHSHK